MEILMILGGFGQQKTKPNKPNQSQFRLAPRLALGVEKTKPICRQAKLAQTSI